MRAKAAHRSALALLFVLGAAAAPVQAATQNDLTCVANRYGGSLNCAAGEFNVGTGAYQLQPSGPTECTLGTQVQVDLVATVSGGQTPRYDLAFFFGQNSNDPRNLGGQCSVTTFPTSPNPWANLDLDAAGDYVGGGGTGSVTIDDAKVMCDANSAGDLAIPYVLSYKQFSLLDVDGPADTDLKPGTTSKCDSGITSVTGMTFRGYVDVVKQTAPDGATQSFAFTASGPGGSNVSPTSFNLVDNNTQRVSMNVVPASRQLVITEPAVAGWNLTSISCTAGTGTVAVSNTVDLPNRRVTLNLTTESYGAVCTFNNTRQTRVRTSKTVSPTSDAGVFNLSVGGTTVANQGHGGTTGYISVTPASSQTFSEAAGTGTALANYISTYQCVNDSTGAAIASGSGTTVSLTPPAQADSTCTFTNTRRQADLSILKTSTPNPATPGQAITYTIVVSNAGPSTAFAAAINDTFPASLTGISWTCSAAGASACGAAGGGGNIATTADVAPGDNVTYTVNATIDPAATGTLANTATVTAPAGTTDPTPVNTSTDNNNLAPSADMAAAVTGFPADAVAGSTVTGTVTCTNNGPSAAAGATCDVTGLPAGATVSCSPPPPTTLAVGAAITCDVSYTAPPSGSVTVTGTADSSTPDPNTANNTASQTTLITESADVSVIKTLQTAGPFVAGQSITYELVVANAGPSTATDIVVTDTPTNLIIATVSGSGCSALPCTIPSLAAAASTTITVTATIDTAGAFDNTVSVDATQDDLVPANNTDTTGNGGTAVAPPSWMLDKATTSVPTQAGDTIIYTFTLTNTGGVDITNISVNDPLLPSLSCIIATLAPGDSATCTATGNVYTVTQSDVDAGAVNNTATATGTPAAGTLPDATDDNTVTIAQSPALTTVKTATAGDPYAAVGDTVTYDYLVTNSGNTTLTSAISVSDDKIASVSCPALPPAGLAPGASITCTGSYTITQADLDAGSVTNNASATDGTTTSPTVSETVTADQSPALTTVKTATAGDPYAAVGDTVTYDYLVTNSGNTTFTSAISVSDDKIASVTCPALPAGGLAPGTSITCTGSYTITQADLDAGSVTNNASATDGTTTSPTVSETVTADQSPALTTVKTATAGDPYAAVGDTVTYDYLVTNSGNTTLTSAISVSDDKIASVTCPALPAGGLAPTQSITCTGSYTITQADLDVGSVTNNASATDGTTTSPTVSETVTADQSPALTTVKTATAGDPYAAVGDTVTYDYLVTNSGNTTLTSAISVSDDKIASVSCPALPAGGLAPGASITCTGSYTITQADLDAGSVTNNATATDGTTTSPSVSETVTADQSPALTTVKTATAGDPYAAVGDTVTYDYLVTNSGNTTITGAISVSDDKIASVSCPALPAGGLAPGTSITCTGSYTITQADLDAGSVTNNASATDGTTTSPTVSETVTADQSPALTTVKTATAGDPYAAVGDTVTYDYLVTNSGNTTLTNAISVSDDKIASVSCPALPAGGLAPGASITCTGSYTITQADLDAGSVTNNASATDGTTTSPTVSETVTADQSPALTTVKTATAGNPYAAVGDTVSYDYLVTNSGNTTFTSAISVSDDKIASVSCPALPAGGLAPGASITCTGSYTITQADLDAGSVTNNASATDGTTTSPSVSETVTADQSPALTTVKTATAGDPYAAVGDTVTYDYLVTNSGNTTITSAISVSDDKIASVSCPALPPAGLAPGASITCTGSYTITQADLDVGSVTNNASATDGTTTSPSVSETVTADQSPALTTVKTATAGNPYAAVGDTVSYDYLVTNSGNTTITSAISVSDDKIASVSCPALPAGGLAPGASITCTGSYTITQADLDAGSVTNNASATDGTTTSPTVSETVTADQSPALTTVKTATAGDPYAAVGDTVTYDYLVTNSGNTTITGAISVSDDKIASVSCPALPAGGLAPGASITCTGSYTITQADLDAGSVTNNATATDGTTTSPSVSETVTADQSPAMTVVKGTPSNADNDASGTVTIGDVLTYTVTVTNTGNVTLTNVMVSDAQLTPNSNTCASVAVGATCVLTGTHTVTVADVNTGQITNTAAADSDQTPSTPSNTVNTPTANRPIVANPDAGSVPNGATGGTAVPNVLVNDTLNGQPATLATVTLSQVSTSNPNVTLDPATGAVNVAAGTPAGTYTQTYQICEIANPSNCATTQVTVTVGTAPIDAVDDPVPTPVNGSTGATGAINVLTNDTLNGAPVNPADITLTPVTSGPLTVNADGTVDVAPNTPAGTYTVTYQICEQLNPANCDTATATVTVGAAPIDAVDDSGTTPQNTPVTTSVLGNDTLNGAAVTPANVIVTIASSPANGTVTVNPDGTIIYTPNAGFSGTDTYTYTVCEQLNPSNCDTATVTITVSPNTVTAVDDSATTPQNTRVTTDLIANDTTTGAPLNPSSLTATVSPGNGTISCSGGTCTYTPNAGFSGTDTFTYRICDTSTPTPVCDEAVVTITVSPNTVTATDDTASTPQNTPVATNVIGNDTVSSGGAPLDPTSVTQTAQPTNGTVTCDASGACTYTPNAGFSGLDSYTYQVCDTSSPTPVCDTAMVTVTVVPSTADVSVTKTLTTAGPYLVGQTVQYTIVIVNAGPAAATDITVVDTVTNLTIQSVTGTCTALPCSIASLAPGASATITVSATIPAAGAFDNTVTATPTETDPNPANNTDNTDNGGIALNVIDAVDDDFTGSPVDGTTGGIAGNVLDGDTLNGQSPSLADVTLSQVSSTTPGLTLDPGTGNVILAAGTPAGTYTLVYRFCDRNDPNNCDTANVTVVVTVDAPQLRLSKQAATREVKIGDLVRYTVIAENVGPSPAINASLIDTPPAGFTFVDGSLVVDDDNDAGTLAGTHPLRINGIDVAVGGRATIVYYLRVGAGVGKGLHGNSVSALSSTDTPISNVATAEVELVGDPLLDDSLILGTVFDDRDGDGWQDPAKASDVRVQGGFAANAYVANSTTIERADSGNGPQPAPDASAPLLHGLALGTIGGRHSTADDVRRQQVVIRQTLRELAFSDDFVLTTGEGTAVRMNAAGQTRVEATGGDAAKGLTAQAFDVTRQVSQSANGYDVAYTIRNTGIDERGIPGVRIASVEGLIMETDSYGRYHLTGVPGGDWSRGRNFILKVDPATLPPGSVFTTENPRVRRITPGIPVRFDFGVKLPAGDIGAGKQENDVELGEVMFDAGSASVKAEYAPLFATIADKLRESDGGSVTVTAQAEQEALAFARARAVQDALTRQLDPALAAKTRVEVVTDVSAGALVSLGEAIHLGTVLFDTDKATIKPQYRGLISAIAAELNQQGRGVIGIIGRADQRGSNAYNVHLGLRRAKAVFEAISAELAPEVRQKVRVDITEDTNAKTGVGDR